VAAPRAAPTVPRWATRYSLLVDLAGGDPSRVIADADSGGTINRRGFCCAVITAAASFEALNPSPRDEWSMVGVGPQPYQVVFDTRFAIARAFGVRAASNGVPTTAIAGDVTALWRQELMPLWSMGDSTDRGSIAGMTTPRTLLCLEQLAHDSWRRVLRREHRLLPPRAMQSHLIFWVIGR
jgi:hypothetical protein